jgi:hypothetical protein
MAIGTVTYGAVAAGAGGGGALQPGYPASPQAGDLLLVFYYCRANTITAAVSGWNTLDSYATANGTGWIFWKEAAGGESGSVDVTNNSPTNGSHLAYMARVPGGATTAPIISGSVVKETEAAASPVTNGGVSPTDAGSLIVLFTGKGDGGSNTTDDYSSWAGNSLTWSGIARGTISGTDGAIGIGTAVKSGTGATGNLTASCTLAFIGISIAFAIKPRTSQTYQDAAADTATVTDSVTALKVTPQAAPDSAAATDTVTAPVVLRNPAADSGTVTDSVATGATETISDEAEATDSVTATPSGVDLGDSATVTDRLEVYRKITITAYAEKDGVQSALTAPRVVYWRPVTAAPAITFPAGGAVLTGATTFEVTAAADSFVRIYADGILAASGQANGAGSASISVPLHETDGSHVYTATAQQGNDAESTASAGVTVATQFTVPVTNLKAAAVIGLRGMMRARFRPTYMSVDGFKADGEGNYGEVLWLVDTLLTAHGVPGVFDSSLVRALVDAFARQAPACPSPQPNCPACFIVTDGTTYYGNETPADGGYKIGGERPLLDVPANWALLACLCYDRGDTSVFAAYKTRMMAALGELPRDGNGLIAVPSSAYTGTWSKEDAMWYPAGGTGMPSVLTAWAYQEIARIATLESDSTTATAATNALAAVKSGLQALRRTGVGTGRYLYNASTGASMQAPHIQASALMVIRDLCQSAADRDATARALVDAYEAGNTTDNGYGLHLYLGFTWPAARPGVDLAPYQDSGWPGAFVGWQAKAMSLASSHYGDASARACVEDFVLEVMREHRAGLLAPWEYINPDYGGGLRGCGLYADANGALALSADTPSPLGTYVLRVSNTFIEDVAVPFGHRITGLQVSCASAGTYTVSVHGIPRTDVELDWNPSPILYGPENATPIIAASLSNETTKSVTAGAIPDASFAGGRVRIRISSGTAPGPVTVTVLQSAAPPTLAADAVTAYTDDFSTNRLGTDYSLVGATWAVSGGSLVNTGANQDVAIATAGPSLAAGQVGAFFRSLDCSVLTGGLIARWVDANNYLLALCSLSGGGGTESSEIYQVVGGVPALLASNGANPRLPLAAGEHHLRLTFNGGVVRFYIDGFLRANTQGATHLTAGKGGLRVWKNEVSAREIRFRRFCVTAGGTGQPIPPGYLLDWGATSGAMCGDNYETAAGTVYLRDHTGSIVATQTAPVKLTY